MRLVSKGGGVGMLVNCLHSSNFRVNRWAAFALGNLLGPGTNALLNERTHFLGIVLVTESHHGACRE